MNNEKYRKIFLQHSFLEFSFCSRVRQVQIFNSVLLTESGKQFRHYAEREKQMTDA